MLFTRIIKFNATFYVSNLFIYFFLCIVSYILDAHRLADG